MEGDRILSIEKELGRFNHALSDQFQKIVPIVVGLLSPEELLEWAEEGAGIASHAFRSWEAAIEYFRLTPEVLESLDFPQFIRWAEYGKEVSQESTTLSCAYFRASPSVLDSLPPLNIEDWMRMGMSLYQGTLPSTSLACRFFETSPVLFHYLSLDEARRFVLLLQSFTDVSYELAFECLNLAEEVFPQMEEQDRGPFLDMASFLRDLSPHDARKYLALGPRLISRVERGERRRFLSMAKVLSQLGESPLSFLIDCSDALGKLDGSFHSYILDLSQSLASLSPLAAIEFIKISPAVLDKLAPQELGSWFDEGMRTLMENRDAGEAYFRLQSMRSERTLLELTRRVDLERIERIISTYCRALSGKDIHILPAERLTGKGIGWTSLERPATEGRSIFLPSFVDRFETKGDNFSWYKVVATHQAAHLEFGSFDFSFDREAHLLPTLRDQLVEGRSDGITDMERFFDLFDDRRLASDIFSIVEDSRVDYLTKQEYPGLVRVYDWVQKDALQTRPKLQELPLREAFIEMLVRMSLGEVNELPIPSGLLPQLEVLASYFRGLQALEATVEDSAEATIRIYQIISQIVNMTTDEWHPQDMSVLPESLDEEGVGATLNGSGGGAPPEALPGLRKNEMPYHPPQEVEYRGDFKPELVQLLAKMRARSADDGSPLARVPPEAIEQLFEKSTEVIELSDGDIPFTSGLFVSNLLTEASTAQTLPGPVKMTGEPGEEKPLESDEPLSFIYDEWDFRAQDYRPRWCCVRERVMEEGLMDFYDRTLEENYQLAYQIRKQFELLAPELLRKIKKLYDGEEFDLDAAIDVIIERRAGAIPDEKIYWRRNKVERDVAVVFLLDMSASTSESIEEKTIEPEDTSIYDNVRAYLDWVKLRKELESTEGYKKIIDVEKETVALLIGALEAIGDTYGIYGFSGYGRENVEFYVIKDIDERFSDRVKRRIDRITPLHATRMGASIRHATSKLERRPSKTKLLFLISDGRPQDSGYGRDGVEKDYAIHDTRMALVEARRKDITPFCLTVDREGHDYLKRMCTDMGYEVVWEIESLPKRLLALYRRMTT